MQRPSFLVGEIVILIVRNKVDDCALGQSGGLIEHEPALFDSSSQRPTRLLYGFPMRPTSATTHAFSAAGAALLAVVAYARRGHAGGVGAAIMFGHDLDVLALLAAMHLVLNAEVGEVDLIGKRFKRNGHIYVTLYR